MRIGLDYDFKKYSLQFNPSDFSNFVLGVDTGGTNTNLGVAGIKETSLELLFSLKFKTKELDSLIPAVNQTLTYVKDNFNIIIQNTCIGAAGVVSSDQDYVKLTNADWDLNTNELIEKTALYSAFIINDFEAIGYGINLLDDKNTKDVFSVRSVDKENIGKTKAILGAGTGLGKSILVYNQQSKTYIPIPCEGGHVDFPVHNNYELGLINFIKEFRNISQPITYEELLSGRGLESIYMFLKQSGKFEESQYSNEIINSIDKAELISKYKEVDDQCTETFRLFSKFYGRCAKNFVLDSLATGGLYIAGGIASKNKEIFSSDIFISEFENAYRYSRYLKETPIYVILDYDISLKGACFAAMYKSSNRE
jgi:glucokinase